jgi:hypothetical protein
VPGLTGCVCVGGGGTERVPMMRRCPLLRWCPLYTPQVDNHRVHNCTRVLRMCCAFGQMRLLSQLRHDQAVPLSEGVHSQ